MKGSCIIFHSTQDFIPFYCFFPIVLYCIVFWYRFVWEREERERGDREGVQEATGGDGNNNFVVPAGVPE